MDFLDRAAQLAQVGQRDDAIDIIYDHMDAGMSAGAFEPLNQVVASADVDALTVEVAIGLLTAANWNQSKIPSYPTFYAKVRDAIARRDGKTEEEANWVLKGLEPRQSSRQ